jgi:hypothetical protein
MPDKAHVHVTELPAHIPTGVIVTIHQFAAKKGHEFSSCLNWSADPSDFPYPELSRELLANEFGIGILAPPELHRRV